MLDRRKLITGAGAAILAGCSRFDTHTGEKASCDIVAYNLNTGLDYLNSSIFNPVMLNDGSRQAKWIFNNLGSDPNGSHNVAPIVVGDTFGTRPALQNTKWIKGTEDNLGGGSLFQFTYCFCVDDSPLPSIPLTQKFGIRELHVQSSHLIHRIFWDTGPILFEGAPGENEFIFDPNSNSHSSFNDHIVEGLNCLHITVMTPSRPIEPMGISVAGLISGISCCG